MLSERMETAVVNAAITADSIQSEVSLWWVTMHFPWSFDFVDLWVVVQSSGDFVPVQHCSGGSFRGAWVNTREKLILHVD